MTWRLVKCLKALEGQVYYWETFKKEYLAPTSQGALEHLAGQRWRDRSASFQRAPASAPTWDTASQSLAFPICIRSRWDFITASYLFIPYYKPKLLSSNSREHCASVRGKRGDHGKRCTAFSSSLPPCNKPFPGSCPGLRKRGFPHQGSWWREIW